MSDNAEFMAELLNRESNPDPLRAALVAIQELHRAVYEGEDAVGCWRCDWEQDGQWPCKTRRLADDALGGGQHG